MKVRKYLQTELWSKKTSWKLLVGSGLVTGFCVAGFVGWNEYEVHWLTSGEREASRAALAEIDSMRGAESLSDEAWEARIQQVRVKIEATRKEVRTYRDTQMEMELNFYLLRVHLDRRKHQRRRLGSGEMPDAVFGGSATELRSRLRKELE
jgi:hypothetical protein